MFTFNKQNKKKEHQENEKLNIDLSNFHFETYKATQYVKSELTKDDQILIENIFIVNTLTDSRILREREVQILLLKY